MTVTAIIAEYNPFHNGHKYQIEKARQLTNADIIIVILSGSFVQRSEPAMISKGTRTLCALKNGADIIIELPSCCVLQPAEKYAESAVMIANALNVDFLFFSSECGDIDIIEKIASLHSSDELNIEIKKQIKSGLSFPTAQHKAIEKCLKEESYILKQPNNILAIEYVKSIKKHNYSIKPVTINRIGTEHDDSKTFGKFASASYIRDSIIKDSVYSKYIPNNTVEIIKNDISKGIIPDYDYFYKLILTKIRTTSIDKISRIRDVSEGIEYRIIAESNKSNSFPELIENIKTKRYTYSRIKRILVAELLGYNNWSTPDCIRLLGLNKEKSFAWKEIRNNVTIPVIEKLSEINNNDFPSLYKEIIATKLWCTLTKNVIMSDYDYTRFPIIF